MTYTEFFVIIHISREGKTKMEIKDAAAEIIATEIMHCINCMGDGADIKKIVSHITNNHPTLVQSFMSRFIIEFIREMNKKYKNGYYDGRNEETCRLCNILWEKIKEIYHIENDNENVSLPFI